ncbi:helix-turn-helix transcriptional regulator [Kitasatospora sp. NPDC093679]|uniref:helix-turn-helix transcriptional regulator n=1 Tax=Kitasatospora sp. NPDC093679 TaxID=3154983 RepID=UPI00343DDDAA
MDDGRTSASAYPSAASWQEFGAGLRRLRRAAGLTQAQLGAAVGYDHTAVSRLEHGSRRTAPRLADRIDELLGAGGELSAACRLAHEREPAGPPLPPVLVRPPLPPTRPPSGGGPVPAYPPPERLPDYGLLCPLHAAAGCTLPSAEDMAVLQAAFCAAGPGGPPPDTDTVHALTGLLAAHLRAGEQGVRAGAAETVEHVLRAVLGRLAAGPAARGRPLARLAAEYAHAAGVLRMQQGRRATAMACFDRALTWSELADDRATQVAALSDMSTLARLDGDADSALGYARAIGRAAPDRHWAGAMGRIGRARAHALAGDVRGTGRHIARARLHLDHIGEPDEADAAWLSIASMRLRVEAGAAAALRDVAAAVGDPRPARHAAAAAATALALLGPGQLPSSQLLFTVRLADCHLCAGDRDAALALLSPALADTPALPALVRHELRGLHDRLAALPPRSRHPDLLAALDTA